MLPKAMGVALIGLMLFGQTAFAAQEWTGGYTHEYIPDIGGFDAEGENLIYEAREGSRMMLRDLHTGGERELARIDGGFTQPDLSGEFVAYRANSPDGSGIYLRNLNTGASRLAVKNTDGTSQLVDYVFHLEDVQTGRQAEVTRIPAAALRDGRNVVFDGTFLVWGEPAAEKVTLRAVDVVTGATYSKEVVGTANPLDADGGNVAYLTRGAENYDSVKVWRPGKSDPVGGLAPAGLTDAALHGDQIAWIAREDGPKWTIGTYGISGNIGNYVLKSDDTPVHHSVKLTDRHIFFVVMGSLAVVTTGAPAAPPAESSQAKFYTVQPGDLLWKLAQRFAVSLRELIRSNNMLNPDLLHVGDKLYLPAPQSPATEEYAVQKGDTLAGIAARYKTNVTNLQGLNRMSQNTDLRIGQLLMVSRGPKAESDAWRPYAVMPGDTLWSIATRSGNTVQALVKLNGWAYPVAPRAGDLLRLPVR